MCSVSVQCQSRPEHTLLAPFLPNPSAGQACPDSASDAPAPQLHLPLDATSSNCACKGPSGRAALPAPCLLPGGSGSEARPPSHRPAYVVHLCDNLAANQGETAGRSGNRQCRASGGGFTHVTAAAAAATAAAGATLPSAAAAALPASCCLPAAASGRLSLPASHHAWACPVSCAAGGRNRLLGMGTVCEMARRRGGG